jgi:hypothetical protein
MASTAERTAAPSTTTSIEPICANSLLEAASQRRLAYELGFRQNEARVATARQQAERWKDEAKWWREEHDRVHADFCEFVAYATSELGLK